METRFPADLQRSIQRANSAPPRPSSGSPPSVSPSTNATHPKRKSSGKYYKISRSGRGCWGHGRLRHRVLYMSASRSKTRASTTPLVLSTKAVGHLHHHGHPVEQEAQHSEPSRFRYAADAAAAAAYNPVAIPLLLCCETD
ncbi:hypothetical protein PG988_001859 [Apiospora saccharicola]